MKKTISHGAKCMLVLFATLLLPVCVVLAQPAWPTTPATVGDYYDQFSSNNTVGGNKRINIDMFSHYVTGSSSFIPDDDVIAVVFDDTVTNETRLMVWDVGANLWDTEPIANASQADVILLDDPGLNMGTDYYVAVVYRDNLTGDVKLTHYKITGVATVNFDLSIAINTFTLNSTGWDADNPHIDAAPSSTTFLPTSGWPPGASIHALLNFAVTWHQYTGSTHEIWTAVDGNFTINQGNTNVTNKMKVDDGIISDIAFARVQDNVIGQTYYKSYFIYDKGSAIHHADLPDAYNTMSIPNTYIAIQSGTVLSPPRIDGGYFHLLNSVGDDNWQAVVGMQNSGSTNKDIHSYQFSNGSVTILDFSDPNFITTAPSPPSPLSSNNAYNPVVATASFFSPWNVGAAFTGNTDYMVGFLFDYPSTLHDHFIAVAQSNPPLTIISGYDEVDAGGVSVPTLTGGGNEPALALSYGTNTGYGNTAAFCNGSTVYVKKTNDYYGTTPIFKPTEIAAVPIPRDLVVYPNPASNHISLLGLKGESAYSITDMLGRLYTRGSLGKTSKIIDVSALPAGMYNVSVSYNNQVKHLKFVKNQ